METTTKICTKCNIKKPLIEFYKDKQSKYGFRSVCKECYKKPNKDYLEVNKAFCNTCNTEKDISMFPKRKMSKNGHSSKCKECSKKYSEEYRKKNKDKLSENKKNYYEKNKEILLLKMKEKSANLSPEQRKRKQEVALKSYYKHRKNNLKKSKEYSEKHKERISKRNADYYNKNKEKIIRRNKQYKTKPYAKMLHRLREHKRREFEKINKPSKEEIKTLVENAKSCYWCGNKLNNNFHLDHYVPLSKGGLNTIDNLVVSCPKCNQTKHAKDPIKFANSIGKLL